jgi:PAS domain S-box-containing protein
MVQDKQKVPSSWPLAMLFIAIIVISATVVLFAVHNRKELLLKEKQKELSTISEIKSGQIVQWRIDRLGSADFLKENILFARKLEDYIREPSNSALKEDILISFRSLIKNFDYRNILLLDTTGRVILSFPGQDSLISDHLRPLIPGIVRERKVKLTDIHVASLVSFVHMDLIVPIMKNENAPVEGLLILRLDPEEFLYPLISSWPASGKTAESFLIRQDGDNVVFLSDLPYMEGNQILTRRPVSEPLSPCAMAVKGVKSTSDAIDYKGHHVVASMNKIPDTGWYLIAKIDREEVLTPLKGQINMFLIILFLLILASGLIIRFFIWNQRVRFYRERHEYEQDRFTIMKQAEDTLKESEERFRKLFEDSPFSMVMTDQQLRILKANNSFCRMTGYEEGELLDSTFRKFTPSEQAEKDEENIKMLISRESSVYQTEKPYIRKDGTTIWGMTTISTVRDNKGEIKFFLAMIEDITSKREASEELEKSFSLLRATIESTADGILVVNSFGKVVLYNKKFVEMWRIPEEIMKTREDKALLDYVRKQLKDPEMFINVVKNLYSDNHEITYDSLEFIDGRHFERYSQPQIINEKSVGRVWSFRDVTERKKAENELVEAKEKAEESDRLKTAFLHNVSHEIRTPMNAIIGFTTLLNERGTTEQERQQFTGIITQSSNQLLSIINDIVDIANIESGQVKVNLSRINLNSCMKGLLEQFSYSKNNISMGLHLDLSDEQSYLVTDETKMIQILSNLINNALKFTQEGRIDFGYRVLNDYVEFFVSDTGIGITAEHQSKIFKRFFQVDVGGTRQYGGTGLGLSICEAYVILLGGEIHVVSEPGKGSRFVFTLPYKSL